MSIFSSRMTAATGFLSPVFFLRFSLYIRILPLKIFAALTGGVFFRKHPNQSVSISFFQFSAPQAKIFEVFAYFYTILPLKIIILRHNFQIFPVCTDFFSKFPYIRGSENFRIYTDPYIYIYIYTKKTLIWTQYRVVVKCRRGEFGFDRIESLSDCKILSTATSKASKFWDPSKFREILDFSQIPDQIFGSSS